MIAAEVVGPELQELAEAEQHLRPFRERRRPPRSECRVRRRDRGVDVGRRRERDLLRHLPGGGVEHVAGPGRRALHELAVDPVGHEREGHAQEYAASTSGPPTGSDDSRPSGPPDLRLAEFRRAGVARQAHADADVQVDGTKIVYEIVGESGPPWVITPGGRFGLDAPGIRELAQELARNGGRVVIWDRPNCGASDVCFEGASESEMQADKLAGLLRALDLAPAVIVGGSGGARVSLLTAVRHPDVTAQLAMLWISGGVYGLMLLATHYCGESIRAAWSGGMPAVVELPEWAEVLERNPANRRALSRPRPSHVHRDARTLDARVLPRPPFTRAGVERRGMPRAWRRRPSSSAVARAIRITRARRRRSCTR